MVFEKFTPKPCRNHGDRTAVYYETASGLYFCADCRNGLDKASSNELRALAGLQPLDYSAELSPKQLEEERTRERERKEREVENTARLEREATTARLTAEAASKAEVERVAAIDNKEKVRLDALTREKNAVAHKGFRENLTDQEVKDRALSDQELRDQIVKEVNSTTKARLVNEQNRRLNPKLFEPDPRPSDPRPVILPNGTNLSTLSDQELKDRIASEKDLGLKTLFIEEQVRREPGKLSDPVVSPTIPPKPVIKN